MTGSFKVAGIQMSSKVGDVKGQRGKRMPDDRGGAKEKVQLVCLPEMFNTGYFARAGASTRITGTWLNPWRTAGRSGRWEFWPRNSKSMWWLPSWRREGPESVSTARLSQSRGSSHRMLPQSPHSLLHDGMGKVLFPPGIRLSGVSHFPGENRDPDLLRPRLPRGFRTLPSRGGVDPPAHWRPAEFGRSLAHDQPDAGL